MNRDDVTLLQIADSGNLAVEFARGLDWDGFAADLRTQSAIIHRLLVIGEAVKRLSPSFLEAHTAIPWSAIAGMRDRLIHQYDTVDLEEVWSVVNQDVPDLLQYLEPLLPRQEGQP